MAKMEEPKTRTWVTGDRPCYECDPMTQYTIMIMGPDDPDRRPRPVGGQEDKTPHRTIAKMTESQIAKAIVNHMADGEARTLNRLSVELWDKQGSITGGTKVEEVLWQLVLDKTLEFTMEAPVLFRMIKKRRRIDMRRAIRR
jgi:hypothetical protein